jgi:SAM-dependent methyltransferase
LHQFTLRLFNDMYGLWMIGLLDAFYPEVRFGGFTHLDGTIAFYVRINELINSESVVLDMGCGRGAWTEDPVRVRRELHTLRGKCKWVIGSDPDPAAAGNPSLHEFRTIQSDTWPIKDQEIDVCICDNVVEHVGNPGVFFRESARVTKKGGYIAIRTPNLFSYFGIASKLLRNPRARLRYATQDDRMAEDVFPVFYRCNTRKRLQRVLTECGFDAYVYGYEAEPPYLSFSLFAYRFGVLHQRLAPEALKIGLVAFAQKL